MQCTNRKFALMLLPYQRQNTESRLYNSCKANDIVNV